MRWEKFQSACLGPCFGPGEDGAGLNLGAPSLRQLPAVMPDLLLLAQGANSTRPRKATAATSG